MNRSWVIVKLLSFKLNAIDPILSDGNLTIRDMIEKQHHRILYFYTKLQTQY